MACARPGDYNLAPTISPDGKLFAFFSSRNLFSIDLFVGDATTGKIIKKLGGPGSDPHFDAISFINSAGDWSPDGGKFAFIVYAEGANEIAILDTKSTNVERRIKLPGIGSVNHVSWSPDGRNLAFSGQAGGISDLYLLDLQAGTIRQLTNDKYADIQPTWSPDGKTIAFSTDRGPQTDFDKLTYSPLQLATYDVATGRISVFSPFARGKHINPQFSPNGQDIFFIADQDGFPDVYRLNLASGQAFRITKVDDRRQRHHDDLAGAVGVASDRPHVVQHVLQSGQRDSRARSVADRRNAGCPDGCLGRRAASASAGHAKSRGDVPRRCGRRSAERKRVHRRAVPLVVLARRDQPAAGRRLGRVVRSVPGFVGGVQMLFGDQLSDRQIFAAIQANGTVKDIGGAVQYINMKNRWNYGAGVEHIPYLTGGRFFRDTVISTSSGNVPALSVNLLVQRIYFDNASISTQYPFSTTKRLELSAPRSHTRVRYADHPRSLRRQSDRRRERDERGVGYKPVWYAGPSISLVGDNSFAAFTSPVQGERYRLQYSPTLGSVTYQLAVADYRRYVFFRPFTVAFRGMSIGRYGKGAEDLNASYPIFAGDETLIRGYGYGSFSSDECFTTGTGQADQNRARCSIGCSAAKSRWRTPSSAFRCSARRDSGCSTSHSCRRKCRRSSTPRVSYTNAQGPDFRFSRAANTIPSNCAAVSTRSARSHSNRHTIRAPIAFRCSAPAFRSDST